MPKTSSKLKVKNEKSVKQNLQLPGWSFINSFPSLKNIGSSKWLYLALALLVVGVLAFYKKEWFVAATINGMPITNLELQQKLNQQFREQTLNQLINEKIILGEVKKEGVAVSDLDIDAKISELEANVGGAEVLNNLLSQQGQTRITLRDQLRLQLSIAKLYDKEATVSAEEIASFLEQNRAVLQATESAAQEKEAEQTLKQQKLGQIFQQKFQELRQKANIKIF